MEKCATVDDLQDSKLLSAFFYQLTLTGESRRCVNYLFKSKCERIDVSYLTMKNMKKVYNKYRDINFENMPKNFRAGLPKML